jgi:opacity protein-like surface antigen
MHLSGVAQPSDKTSYLEGYAHPQKSNVFTAIGVGFSGFDGTLAIISDNDNQNRYLNPQISLDAGYQLTNYIAVIGRANYIRLNVTSDREGDRAVSANNYEGMVILRHYLFSQKQYDEYLRKFNYYGFGGIGALYFNPKDAETSEAFAETESFDQWTTTVPVGIGTEYHLSNFFSMALEASYHFTGSDFIDGKEGPNINGNDRNDRFALFNARVTYRLPRRNYKYNDFLKLKNQEDKINQKKKP